MILRDIYCDRCGFVVEDQYLALDVFHVKHPCPRCKTEQGFSIVANGGTRKRVRIQDWPTDPEFYRGQIKVGAVEAHDGTRDGPATRRPDGSIVHDSIPDRRAEREDRRYHKLRRKRSRGKIYSTR